MREIKKYTWFKLFYQKPTPTFLFIEPGFFIYRVCSDQLMLYEYFENMSMSIDNYYRKLCIPTLFMYAFRRRFVLTGLFSSQNWF